jgi:hypothetical protein
LAESSHFLDIAKDGVVMKKVLNVLIVQLFIIAMLPQPVLAIESLGVESLSSDELKRYHQLVQQGLKEYNRDRWDLDSRLMQAPKLNGLKEIIESKGIKQLPKITTSDGKLVVEVDERVLTGFNIDFLQRIISVGKHSFKVNPKESVEVELKRLVEFLKQHPPRVEKLSLNLWDQLIFSSAWAEPVTTSAAAGAVAMSGGQVAFALAGTTVFIIAAAGLIVLSAHVMNRLYGDFFADKIIGEFNQNLQRQLERCQTLPAGGQEMAPDVDQQISNLFRSYNTIADYRLYDTSREAIVALFPWSGKLTVDEHEELKGERDCANYSRKMLEISNRYKWVDHKLTAPMIEQVCLKSQQLDDCLKGLGTEVYNGQRGDIQKEYFGIDSKRGESGNKVIER